MVHLTAVSNEFLIGAGLVVAGSGWTAEGNEWSEGAGTLR